MNSYKNISANCLSEIFSPLIGENKLHIFVHGSWADNSKTEFSDLDDFIIINSNTSKAALDRIKNKLKDVELIFQRIDPLQHHGHWLIMSDEMVNYDNSYIPQFILNDAIVITGDQSILKNFSVNSEKTRRGLINNILNTCKDINNFYFTLKEKELNVYNLKCLVSSIALLPPLIFQLFGKEKNKKCSIESANEIFEQNALKLLSWASDCRKNWSYITSASQYTSFVSELDEFSSASQWREYASYYSPILNYSTLSTIELTDSIVNDYIRTALKYVDGIALKSKNLEDYISGYKAIEVLAIELGAIAVGRFGSINHPGVSDLDIFICFPDENYSAAIKTLDSFIERDTNLSYLVTHEPVVIAESMLPYIKLLHTLYDLEITYTISSSVVIDIEIETRQRQLINRVWTVFLFTIIDDLKDKAKFLDLRSFLLVLKNIHTSIDNTYRELETNVSAVKRSNAIRNKLLYSTKEKLREEVINEFIFSLSELNIALQKASACNFYITQKSVFILNRRTLFVRSNDTLKTVRQNKKATFYLCGYMYDLAFEIFITQGSTEAKEYSLAYSKVKEISYKLNAQFPFIHPFNLSFNSKLKRRFFKLINLLPDSILLFLFRF